MLAADAVIAEVAGQDQEWQEHIREDDSDGTSPEKDTQPWETEEWIPTYSGSGILEGAFV